MTDVGHRRRRQIPVISSKRRYHTTTFLLLQQLLPVLLLKAHQNCIPGDDDGPLDQHAVGGQQSELLLPGHGGELVLQPQVLVDQTAGVEELLQLQAALLLPEGKLLGGGILLLDVPGGEFQTLALKPGFGLLAGGAAGIFEK